MLEQNNLQWVRLFLFVKTENIWCNPKKQFNSTPVVSDLPLQELGTIFSCLKMPALQSTHCLFLMLSQILRSNFTSAPSNSSCEYTVVGFKLPFQTSCSVCMPIALKRQNNICKEHYSSWPCWSPQLLMSAVARLKTNWAQNAKNIEP